MQQLFWVKTEVEQSILEMFVKEKEKLRMAINGLMLNNILR